MKALLLVFSLLLSGCGSTRIVSQDPNAEIFLDDESLGVGEAEIGRVGPPREVTLEAKRDGQTVGDVQMRRSFTGMTLVWGLFSYYTGLYWGWYFPKTVTIPNRAATAAGKPDDQQSPWANPRGNVWMQPLK